MTAAADLLQELSAKDVRLTVTGERLHIEAAAGTLTPELRERLKARKPELIALLRARDAGAPTATPGELANLRATLRAVAASLGYPAKLIAEIRDAELAEWIHPPTDYTREQRHASLILWVRALDGESSALRGTLAARDAPARQAHVADLRLRAGR